MRSRGVTLLCTIVLLLLGASAAVDRVRHNDAVHSSPSPSTLPSRTSPSLRLSAGASCANNGTACPPPLWAPQWNLTLSTVCQPSTTGYFVPPPNQPWGLVSLDWSVASDIWHKATLNTSTIEATSIEGCRRIKANSPGTRCFIYHNMELALEAMESQRLVMYDSLYANWFLQYQTPSGMKNGTIYNEPGGPGDQYFWDFRVAGARDFFVNSVLAATSDPAVDGTYSDDVDGFPAEHSGGPANINMTAADVADLQYWTQSTHARLLDELISRNKYNWQAFGYEDGTGPSVTQSSCQDFMTARCTPQYQSPANPTLMGMDDLNHNASVAAFLITRSPYAWLGYGWESDQSQWKDIFLLQVGEPQGTCVQSSKGIFTRPWTYGSVTLNCNNYTSSIPTA